MYVPNVYTEASKYYLDEESKNKNQKANCARCRGIRSKSTDEESQGNGAQCEHKISDKIYWKVCIGENGELFGGDNCE